MDRIAQLNSADEGLVAALARMLAGGIAPGRTLLLDGPVGAGKTHFARAFIRARQGEHAEDVPSPTFTLVQTYDDPMGGDIWHADLYRLSDPSELDELGLDEALGQAICLIEWPDRLDHVPEDALWLRLANADDPALRNLDFAGRPGDWPDLPRLVARAGFVHGAGWGDARVQPLAGDASARRYYRLRRGDDSAVLMDDAPPGSIAAFVAMTDWLRARGFGAPQILAQDAAQGFLLIEDLGDDLVARVIADDPALTGPIYERIVDFLLDLHRHAPPDFVQPLDGPALADLTGLFDDWYPAAAGITDAPPVADRIAQLYDRLCGGDALVTSLRDFHAENLIWRGGKPLGLLDYQDAVAAHPAYDLVSALQDARRDIDPALEAQMIARYIAATGVDGAHFRAAYALLGVQRGLRIIGIFTRLCLRDGKQRYLAFMPRVWGYVRRNLDHPALGGLADLIGALPAPDDRIIERIAAQCRTR